MNTSQRRLKSREYPAISLKRAVELAQRLYDADRWAEAPARVAVQHLGYTGLNGSSLPVLSALKKFGLVEYLGTGDAKRVRLTELAKRMLLPVNPAERSAAIREALAAPALHAELLAVFPDWQLPSDETLAARLEREFRLQHAAIKPFIADLRAGLEFAAIVDDCVTGAVDVGPPASSLEPPRLGSQIASTGSAGGLMKLPMPGSSAYIMLPESLRASEAKRTLSWLQRVVTPAIEFAAEQVSDDEPA